MYGIFESTSNNLIGFCSTREKADIYVATENLDWGYDHYYIDELELLDEEIVKCGENLKKQYNIVFNFPLSPTMNIEHKKHFTFSELEIVDRKDAYYPYFGEERPTNIKAYDSCILVSLTAVDFESAVEKSTALLREALCGESELIVFKTDSK